MKYLQQYDIEFSHEPLKKFPEKIIKNSWKTHVEIFETFPNSILEIKYKKSKNSPLECPWGEFF